MPKKNNENKEIPNNDLTAKTKKRGKKKRAQSKYLKKLNMKAKKGAKVFIVIICALLIAIAVCIAAWFIKPSSSLYFAMVDKTVPATSADSASYLDDVDNIYRKHIGANWILDYMKIKNPETKDYYSIENDYYGNHVDNNYNLTNPTYLENIKEIPDILYLSDSYGTELNEEKGISENDMNTIALCHSMGSVVIGEQDILTTGTSEEISAQLQNLFGIKHSGWVGRYIYDLADLTDVPYWAPPMYKEKYGVEWRCSGSGILLVSNEGDIIVLEAKKDFEDDNLLNIRITDKYKKEFGKASLNYYSWFELVEPTAGSQTIAEYEFNLNKEGMEEFAPVSDTPVFSAVIRNTSDDAPTYYFAGDFNDFVDDFKPFRFIGSDLFYQWLSFDKDGDVTHFYWHFFEPMFKKIVKDVQKDGAVNHNTNEQSENEKQLKARLDSNKLQIYTDKKWVDFRIKGFNMYGEKPGNAKFDYSDSYDYYKNIIAKVASSGANVIRTYDLYSPDFYRALYEYNQANDNKIYLIEGISLNKIDTKNITSDATLKLIKQNAEYTVSAMFGNANLKDSANNRTGLYRHNVSQYLLGYDIDLGLSDKEYKALAKSNYSYSGKYYSANGNGAEALYANILDTVSSFSKEKYDNIPLIFSKGSTSLLSGAFWAKGDTFNLSNIKVSDDTKSLFAVSYTAKINDDTYQKNKKNFKAKKGATKYDAYLSEIKKNNTAPVLIDSLGASSSVSIYDNKNKELFGLSEEEQANQIIDMYKSVNNGGFVGGLVSNINDSWNDVGSDSYATTVPLSNAYLWHDVTDINQTNGILSVDSAENEDSTLSVAEADQNISGIDYGSDEGYLYVTINMKKKIDYEKQVVVIGLDTYKTPIEDEYKMGDAYKKLFGKTYSGLEFLIRIDNKDTATLYCVPSYNRKNGSLGVKAKFDADFNKVATLKYGSFATQNTQYFMTGNNIRLRLPWAMLNVTDASRRIIINDSGKNGASGIDGQYRTTISSGVAATATVSKKKDMERAYEFPSSKRSPAYKRYAWSTWEESDVKYQIREKSAFKSLKNYFITY